MSTFLTSPMLRIELMVRRDDYKFTKIDFEFFVDDTDLYHCLHQ